MNARTILHAIVEKLPESELITAARILTALEQPADPLRIRLADAPEDDESLDPMDLDGTDDEPFIYTLKSFSGIGNDAPNRMERAR